MPRKARVVIPAVPHHITQRGNNRQDVFFTEDDRRLYLSILREQSKKFGLKILGFCLMTNHLHVIATPLSEISLARTLGRTHLIYTQTINLLHQRSGHIWQNRFYSCALDEHHLIAAIAYAERNPVRAGMVRFAWEYPWSSAAAHLGEADRSGILDLPAWESMPVRAEWKDWLVKPEEETMLAALRLNTSRGRPLGSDSFLSKLECTVGRRLRPLAVGRPKKEMG